MGLLTALTTLFLLGVICFVLASPLWVPVTFAAYAIARRQFELNALFAFMTTEAVCLALWAAMLASGNTAPDFQLTEFIGAVAALGAPFWIPVVSVTIAQTRGRCGLVFIIVCVAIELLSIALWCILIRNLLDDFILSRP